MSNRYVPVHNINVPGGGKHPYVPQITKSTPVHSSYTGDLVQFGNIVIGTPHDAPPGTPNYGGNYHVIIYNPENRSYMAHAAPSQQRW